MRSRVEPIINSELTGREFSSILWQDSQIVIS